MRIDHLHITNFRSFEDRTFGFVEGFTLLIGANATGKTAVLDALAIAIGAALTEIPDAYGRLIRRADVRRSHPAGQEVAGYEEHYPVCVSARGAVGGKSMSWRREFRTAKSHTTHRETRNVRNAMRALASANGNGGVTVLPCLGYYGAGRLWLEQRKTSGIDPSGQQSRYAGYRNCLTRRSSTPDLVRWVKRLALIQAQKGVPLATLTAILEAMVGCIESATRVAFDFAEDDISVTFADGVERPFWMLSDGQRGMAALVADIAMRCTLLNPHLNGDACRETPGVVLIDELDLHLHPRWQRRVVEDLRRTFPAIQFIATSHSPFIIQSMADRGSVISLDAEDGEPSPVAQNSIEDVAEDLMHVEQPSVAGDSWR